MKGNGPAGLPATSTYCLTNGADTVRDTIDLLFVLAYPAILMAIGFVATRRQKNLEDYLIGGRNVGWFVVMTSWLASWVGGGSTLATVNNAYNIGLSAFLYPLAIAVSPLWFHVSRHVFRVGDRLKQMAFPDVVEDRYDTRSRVVAAITTFLAYIAYTTG